MRVEDCFSAAELEEIRAATAAAEKRTAGEVVTVVVERCARYDAALWAAATLGALGAVALATLWHELGGSWSGGLPLWRIAPPVVGAAVGYLAARAIPALRRALTRDAVLDETVARRAAAAFLAEEVFATRDRTGVLILLALFERRVEVLCDRGIRERVPAGEWRRIADDVARGLGEGRATSALVAAIEDCGDLLVRHAVERRPDDVNELADDVRLRDA